MWELAHRESWAPKNLSFRTMLLRRLLRIPWTARRSNQLILKEISPEYSLERLMLKLKLLYFGHWCKEPTHWKSPWCWGSLKAKGEEGSRGWDCSVASQTQWTWIWANSEREWSTRKPGVPQSMDSQELDTTGVTEQLSFCAFVCQTKKKKTCQISLEAHF